MPKCFWLANSFNKVEMGEWYTDMRIVFSVFFSLMVCFSAQVAVASCVTIALLDDAGAVIKPNGLVVGIKIGADPVFVIQLPPHAAQREVGPTACTPNVIKPIQDLYNLSCRSEQAMMQAAESNARRLDFIMQRCIDLKAALVSALNSQ
ncbi:MAG: hypothetical protein GKS03_11650 [Alphaproteobacteria bacterium]|nr:hypothetical protein [Alphaproteobacteria bacterium]